MRIGCHGFVFSGSFDEAGIRNAIEGTQRGGFDFIEMPLMDPFSFDEHVAARVLEETGIEMTASLGLTAATDLSSEDPATVQRGEDLLRRAIDIVGHVGGTDLCGVIYSALQKYDRIASDASRENSAAALRRLGDYAAERNVILSLEIVNRYETNIMNTAREGLRFLELVGHDNVHLHLDTYHMNIEESGMYEPVADLGDKLRYVHIGESHRGYLGSGSVDFGSLFRALVSTGFDGPVVFESFSSTVVDESLTRSLGIWRNLWEDSDDLAAHANRFVRDGLRSAETIRMH
ncbi:MAG TPA: sugar phosphate isomerase/epimerase [Candidatus Agrococcus pullicola]|uniref:Sugar phosphate isomerase/epimerase n=1 Tax=Candidatus Agrococcus pullicola TaxID=2838429 RepID=A0A9D1Z0Q2_9MICO|nr:sugar phosphate isomerase/epimerase [Candidatus Agrococcus pullicola]